MGKHFKRLIIVAILLLGSIGVLLDIAPAHTALAANPATINFQGKVTNPNGTNVADGTYSFVFRLYQNVTVGTYNPNTLACASDTNCWWEETDSVVVTSGTFQVSLGATCAFTSACNSGHSGIDFNTQNALSLTMKFNGDTAGYMTPLIPMQSVPYALNSDKLGGIAASGFIQNNSGSAQTSSSFHIDGTGIADVKLQAPAFDTATSAGALGIGSVNAGAITIGNTTNTSVLFKTKYTAAALQVQNAGGNEIFTIDGSATEANNFVRLGKTSTINGRIVFDNATNANAITLVSGATAASGGTGYSLTLPTTGGAGTQCLQSTSGSTVAATVLTFAGCGSGSGTLASTYNSAATTGNTIALATAGGGIAIQDASTTVGNIFSVQKNGGTSNYFNVTSSAITIEDSGATHRTAVSIDITGHALKVYSADGTTNFASITATNTDATFKSNTGNTIIGSGSGAVTVNAGSGSAVNITGHANSVWQVDTGGTLTIQGGSTLSLLSTTTSAITLDSGSTGTVNIGTGANGKAIAIGNAQTGTTVTSTAGTVTQTLTNTGLAIKTNTTNSATAFQIQNAGGTTLLNVDTTNGRVSIGSNGTDTGQLYVAGQVPTSATNSFTLAHAQTIQIIGGRIAVATDYNDSKLFTFDVSNPASIPTALNGTGTSAAGNPQGMVVAGQYAYLAENSGGNHLEIFDISNPSSPTLTGSVVLTGQGQAVTVTGKYAFVGYDSGVDVIDISNPKTPVKLGTDAIASNYATSLISSGQYVYVGASQTGTSAKVKVIDVNNPLAFTAGVFTLSGTTSASFKCDAGSNWGDRDLAISGRYLFAGNCGNKSIDVFDISNPLNASGTPVTTIATTGFNANAGPAELVAQGHYLYATIDYFTGGVYKLATYDISAAASVTAANLVGSVNTGAVPVGLAVSGRYAYTANFSASTVQVFDIGGAYVQQLEAGGTETGSLVVNNDATIGGNTNLGGSLQVAQAAEIGGALGVNGPAMFQNLSNSTTAFQVQTSGGAAVLTADTANSQILFQGANSIATFGSELLSSSTCSGTNWAGSGTGPYTHTTGSVVALSCTPPASVSSGNYYQVVFNVGGSVTVGQTVTAQVGGTNSSTAIGKAVTGETELIEPTGTTGLKFIPTSTFNGTVTIVSLKQLTQSVNNVIGINNSDGTTGIEIRSGGSSLENTYIGVSAGEFNTTGSDNTAFGYESLVYTTSGSNNNAVGNEALEFNTTGNNNVANGPVALNANTSGGQNTGIGAFALENATIANDNSATGYNSLASDTIGLQNSGFGSQALNSNVSGNNNASLGYSSGNSIISGSNNTFVGSLAGYQDPITAAFATLDDLQNATAIGYGAQVQQSNSLILGGQDSNSVNIGIGTTAPDNLFSISPDIYDTGTASTSSSATVVGAGGASWSSTMVGDDFIFANGNKYTIVSVTDATHMVLSSSSSNTSQAYRIHNPAFFVSSTGSAAFRSSTNSTTAFEINNATNTAMFGVNTTNAVVSVGSGTTDTNQVLLQTDSFSTFADTATCTTTNNQGGMYYNTASNSIRACINGAWEDLVSTAGLGIISFGVVADSGSNPGDLPSLVTAGVTGPCKVSWTSVSTVTVAPCVAYSAGRKVIVSSTVLTLTTTTTNRWENVCLSGANGAPALVGPANSQTSATIFPTFSANNPIECIATLQNGTATNGRFTTAGNIFDTRTFTQSVKEFQTSAAAVGLGYMAQTSGSGITISTATAGTLSQRGVVVATNGAAASGNNPNVIIVTNGPGYVVANAGTAGQNVESSGTAGFANTTATATLGLYAYLGVTRTTWAGATCASAASCLGSLYLDITPR